MKYIVIIVDKIDDTHRPITIDDTSIEYVSVGQQFHGRHFRGNRPTHVIDRSKVRKWFEYMERMTMQYEKAMAIQIMARNKRIGSARCLQWYFAIMISDLCEKGGRIIER